MDPATTPTFKDNLILFQTLSKKRSYHLKNVSSLKNTLISDLKAKVQSYASNLIKFNEFTNNQNNYHFNLTDISNILPLLNLPNESYFQTIFNYIKNNPLFLYELTNNCSSGEQKKVFAKFINNNLFKNGLTLKSAEDEFMLLITKIIYEDLNVDFKENEAMFKKDSIMYYIVPLMRNSWEISHFIYELLLVPFKVLNNQKEKILVLDIEKLNNEFEENFREVSDVNVLHEKAVEFLYAQKNSTKFKDINNFYLNSLIETAYETKDYLPSKVTERHSDLFVRNCGVSSNTFSELIEKENNAAKLEYLNFHLDKTYNNNNTLYANIAFINKGNNMKNSVYVQTTYLKHCSIIISIIDSIIESLLLNKVQIPLCIKYICKIIEIVYKQKKREASDFEIIKALSVFLFDMVINPVIINPQILPIFNIGFLPFYKRESISIIMNVLSRILKGELYEDKQDVMFTKLNKYCVASTLKIIDLFTQIKNEVKLQEYVNTFIENETKSIADFDYFKLNPNESINNNYFIFSIEDIIVISQANEELINAKQEEKFVVGNESKKYGQFLSSLSSINEKRTEIDNLNTDEQKNQIKNYYLVTELKNLNGSSKKESEYHKCFLDELIFIIENIKTFDSAFFETYNLTSMESLISNLPSIIKDPQYMLITNYQFTKSVDNLIEKYESLTNELKNECNTNLTSLISSYQKQIEKPYLPELSSIEEYISIINKNTNELQHLLILLEDQSLSNISKMFIENHYIPLETILSKAFFSKNSYLSINDLSGKKVKKSNGITENIKEFCDNFSQYQLKDFFPVNINTIIEQYHKSDIPKEINKVFSIIQNNINMNSSMQTYIKQEPGITNIQQLLQIMMDKIVIYVYCRLESILMNKNSSEVDNKLINKFVFLKKIDISSQVNAMKSKKMDKINHCITLMRDLSSSSEVLPFFVNVISLIEDYKQIKKSSKFLIIFYYFIKFHLLNLNTLLDYINCFYIIRDNKTKEVFRMMNTIVSIILKLKKENYDNISSTEEFNAKLLEDILSQIK